VYLYIKNLRTTRLSKGLDHVKVKPFLLSKQYGLVTYKLELPLNTKIFNKFYISLLELADSETLLQRTFRYETEEEKEFRVEKILDHRDYKQIKLREFLVK
jgi:hypothetical protein